MYLIIPNNFIKKLNEYPGFNGVFTRPVLKVGPGSYLGDIASILKYTLECNPVPAPECKQKG